MRGSTAVLSTGLAAGLIAVLLTAPPAAGDPPDDANCLGVVTSQRAVANHDIGEHASSQEEPRLGLGNAAEEVLGDGTTSVSSAPSSARSTGTPQPTAPDPSPPPPADMTRSDRTGRV